jgi:hypothetical protein
MADGTGNDNFHLLLAFLVFTSPFGCRKAKHVIAVAFPLETLDRLHIEVHSFTDCPQLRLTVAVGVELSGTILTAINSRG